MSTTPGFHTQHQKNNIGSLLPPSAFRALCSKNEVQRVLVMGVCECPVRQVSKGEHVYLSFVNSSHSHGPHRCIWKEGLESGRWKPQKTGVAGEHL